MTSEGFASRSFAGDSPMSLKAPRAKGLDDNIGTLRKRHEFETPGIFAQVQLNAALPPFRSR